MSNCQRRGIGGGKPNPTAGQKDALKEALIQERRIKKRRRRRRIRRPNHANESFVSAGTVYGADRLTPFSIWIKQRHFYGRQKHFSSPPPARSRLTFWPRFYISRNYLRNRVEVKDGGLYSTYLCTEFRCGSCSDSHFSWRGYICKI
jgi:hypothetical protein